MPAQRHLILIGRIDAPDADGRGAACETQLRHRTGGQTNNPIIAHRPAVIDPHQDRASAVERRHLDIAGQRQALVRGGDRARHEGFSIGGRRAFAAGVNRLGIAQLIIGGRIGRSVCHARDAIGLAQQLRPVLHHGGGALGKRHAGAERRRQRGEDRLIA